MLQRESRMPNFQEEVIVAPQELIQGAADFHPYAEAAYTVSFITVVFS